MNPVQTENIFAENKIYAFRRVAGAVLLAAAVASCLFAYFGAAYFAGADLTSKIVYLSLSLFLGVLFSALGLILILIPNRKLEINPATGRILLMKKIFGTTFEEFAFADIERVELVQHELENGTLYLPRIIFLDGKIIDVPSENQGDEKYQTEIFERVKNLLDK